MADFNLDKKYNYNWQNSKFKDLAFSGSYISQFINDVGYVTSSTAVSASYATSASYAATASYLLGSITSASHADQADNALAIDVYSFSSPVDSYLLMSNVIAASGVAVGGDTDLRYNASTNKLTVGTVSATSFTGSLLGTASYAIYAETASSALNAQDILINVLNQSGYNIAKGVVVHITASGNSSDVPRIITASYENDNNSANTLGITNEAIANGSQGFVMTEGVLKGVNTQAFQSGQLVYLGATGSIIGTAPVAPLHSVRLGQVVRHQSNNGSIYVRIDNGYELEELHDVLIVSASSGDLVARSGSVWINSRQLTGSYGLTGSLNATSFTGSLLGTASYAAQALSASFAPSTPAFPYTGSAGITGSLTVVGPTTSTQIGAGSAPSGSIPLDVRAQGALSTNVAFRVRNSANNKNIMEVRGDSETRWTGLTAVGNYVAIKNYTSYDANIDLMGGNSVKVQIYNDVDSNSNINKGLNLWNPGIVGSATAKINNIVKSGLAAYGQGYGFNWAFTSNASGIYTQAERAMWLTPYNSLVFYTGSSSPIDVHLEKTGSFEIFASSSTSTVGVVPHFKTERGTIIWLGSQSRLFNVTASNITASSVVSSFTGSLTGSVTNYETAWTPYTPVWTTDGVTQPVIGDGSITGAYKQIGKTVFVRVRLYYGTTTTSGTGTFYFSLPVTSSTTWGIQMPVSMLDNGNAWYQATANGEYGGFTTKTALIGQSAGGANSSQGVTGTFPFTFGNLDSIQFNGTYESA